MSNLRHTTPQKRTARANSGGHRVAAVRIAGLLASAIGMGIVGYLISQGYDGLFAASLASALTSVSVIGLKR